MEKMSAGKRLYEQVIECVQGMIEQGVYKKGDLLPSEKDLMEMVGVSRVTVREAMRILSEAGVIRTVKGKGSFVLLDRADLLEHSSEKRDCPQNFMESTEIRLLLEPSVARYVAYYGKEEHKKAIGENLNSSGGKPEAFHMAIVQATENQTLIRFFQSLFDIESRPLMLSLVPPFRQKSVAAKIRSQHERIYEAIRNGDGEFAYFYMLEHQNFIKVTYQEFFDRFCK